MRVYCFTNHVNGKVFVGVTSRTLDCRWLQHVLSAQNDSSHHFHQAIREHGGHSFEGIVLEECKTTEEASTLKRMWIGLLGAKHCTLGYNAPIKRSSS